MKTIITKLITFSFLSLLASSYAFADSNEGYEFSNGSSVIWCERTEPVPKEDFQAVYGHWLNFIMEKQQEGTVYLSQFTQNLNKGLVIVINKHSLVSDNVKEAEKMLAEMNQIALDKGVKREDNACKIMAMGPIWLKPTK